MTCLKKQVYSLQYLKVGAEAFFLKGFLSKEVPNLLVKEAININLEIINSSRL
jgi:hypothetical protein